MRNNKRYAFLTIITYNIVLLLLLKNELIQSFQQGYQSSYHSFTNLAKKPFHTSYSNTNSRHEQELSALPKLIVFDLDNTLWSPELYQIRRKISKSSMPIAGKDVKLFKGSSDILDEIIASNNNNKDKKDNIQLAIASRTTSVVWANDLLNQFNIKHLFNYIEIYPGSKVQHFTNLSEKSGIPYKEMIFFDDARDGQYGNCKEVSNMGVLSVHCPNGLHSKTIYDNALQQFSTIWNKSANTIVEQDGNISTYDTTVYYGLIKGLLREKRFGFIRQVFVDEDSSNKHNSKLHQRNNDVFFHFNDLPKGCWLEEGDEVSYQITIDEKNGKNKADNIVLMESSSLTSLSNNNNKTQHVDMNVFSMSMPFAALLANGYKTLESRNNDMFLNYPPGSIMLLHVGRRDFPDEDKHIDIMKNTGLTQEDIHKLKSLPPGYEKGMVIAIVEIGDTYLKTASERSHASVQSKVVAYGVDSGRYVTEINSVEYLKHPKRLSGQPGIFNVSIDRGALEDVSKSTWLDRIIVNNKRKRSKYAVDDIEVVSSQGSKPKGKLVYTITG